MYKESSKTESDNKTTSKEDLVNGLDEDSDVLLSDGDEDDSLSDMTEGILKLLISSLSFGEDK